MSRDPIEEVGSYPSIIVKQMLFDIFSEYRNAYLRLALNKDGNLAQRIAYIEVAGRYNKLLHFIIIGEPTIMLSFYGANNYINSMNNLIDYFDIFGLSDSKCPPDDKDKCPPGDKAKVGSAGPWILGLGGGGLISSGLALAKANVRRSITTPLMVVGAISSVLGTIWGTVIPDKEDVEKKIKSNGGSDHDSKISLDKTLADELLDNDVDEPAVSQEDIDTLKDICK